MLGLGFVSWFHCISLLRALDNVNLEQTPLFTDYFVIFEDFRLCVMLARADNLIAVIVKVRADAEFALTIEAATATRREFDFASFHRD